MPFEPKPVCIWFYTRAENLRRILSVVASYRPHRLYLVSDGPRPQDAELNRLARRVVEESITWPCEVKRNYADTNLGLQERIVSGVDWVFQQEESAIFLEDDIIPDPSFFPYCEALLNHYRDDERIMVITGGNPLSGRVPCPDSYLFSRYFHTWGLAMWRRTWKLYDVRMTQWPTLRKEKAINGLYAQEYMRKWMTRLFDSTYDGRTSTWDIQLFFTCLFNNGLSIVPSRNLISNIGFEGIHTSSATGRQNLGTPLESIDWQNLKHPRYVCPSFEYDDAFCSENFAWRYPPPSLWRRLCERLKDGFTSSVTCAD